MRSFVFLCIATLAVFANGCSDTVRTIDGTCNNVQNPLWGSAGQFFRELEGHKTDWDLIVPNPRNISNKVFATKDVKPDTQFTATERRYGLYPDPRHRNSFFVAFAQFVSHDIGFNPTLFTFNPALDYKVPILDPTDHLYQPELEKYGILSTSSQGVVEDGKFLSFNNATSYLDLSTVYGSSNFVAGLLRSFTGGRLKTDPSGGLLPFGDTMPQPGVPSECGAFRPGTSAAGDLRADENVALTSIHTIFLREHNRLADEIAASSSSLTDEQIYQAARTTLIATYQHIVFDEFLPLLLGPFVNRIKNYRGYNENINPAVTDVFSGAAFRIVHDMVSLPVLILDQECTVYKPPVTDGTVQEGSNCIPLFFRSVGMEAGLRGALNQYAQAMDGKFTNGIRDVFLRPTSRGGNLDIEALNIFRGREHQLPDFNSLVLYHTGKTLYQKPQCNAGPVVDSIQCFKAITSNTTLALMLQDIYKKVSNVDAYVGLALEDIKMPAYMPATTATIVSDQFERIRNGDRFWYENRDMYSRDFIRDIKRESMADLISRNSNVQIGNKAFLVHDECNLEGGNPFDD